MQGSHAEKERGFEDQISALTVANKDGGELRSRHDDLERENQELQQDCQELQQELLEQQRVTDEVRREAASFLEEMKGISDRSDKSWQREEQLGRRVQSLEAEVEEWKGRYARAKAQLRSNNTGSTILSIQPPHLEHEGSLLRRDGLVRNYNVTQFQIAVDQALQVARQTSGDAKAAPLLDQMKAVVAAVKRICEDVDGGNPELKTTKMRLRVSATANNFITAAKNYAYAKGVSPVSLLDAAASHLSAAIVDLVHAVKMRPAADGELEDEEEGREAGYDGGKTAVVNGGGRISPADSIYSSTTASRASNQKANHTAAAQSQTSTNQYASSSAAGRAQTPTHGRKPSSSHSRNQSSGHVRNASSGHVRNASSGHVPNGRPAVQHAQQGSYDFNERDEDIEDLKVRLHNL